MARDTKQVAIPIEGHEAALEAVRLINQERLLNQYTLGEVLAQGAIELRDRLKKEITEAA